MKPIERKETANEDGFSRPGYVVADWEHARKLPDPMRAQCGIYEGAGCVKCRGRDAVGVVGRELSVLGARELAGCVGWAGCVPRRCAGSRQCPGSRVAGMGSSAAEASFALVGAHDAIRATARSGSLSSTTRGWGHAARRARSLVVSEPHAALADARQRISPSRRP